MSERDLPFDLAVVGDDGRKGGEFALLAAAALHKAFGTTAHVIHSLDVPRADELGATSPDAGSHIARLAESAMDVVRHRADARLGRGKAETQVDLIPPHAALIRAARTRHADLIVLGPHRKQHFFDLGGTQRAVLSGAPCHVWSQPTEPRSITGILAPCDLSERSLGALEVAVGIARRLRVPITALHVSEPPVLLDPMANGSADLVAPAYVLEGIHEAARTRFEERMSAVDWTGVEHLERFTVGPVARSIEDARRDGDLVVMGTRGHTGLGAAILGGVTNDVLKQASGPVLALR